MRQLLTGDEAVALAARDAAFTLGTGYPGTPSTEILEALAALGARAQWAPNEKVALEVGLGVAFAGGRALVTMRHAGLAVAADPLFTAASAGVAGALVVVTADDPGMHAPQDERDDRRYAVAAGLPMLEPADAQEAYDLTHEAARISERYELPVLLRMTTRVCHSRSVVLASPDAPQARLARFERGAPGRVVIPSSARPAHRRLRRKLAQLADVAELHPANRVRHGSPALGVVAAGVCRLHAREAAPGASFLELGIVHPLPMKLVREFVEGVERCVVLEEGDPLLADAIRAAGIPVESAPERHRAGELDVGRARAILSRDAAEQQPPPGGSPPALCAACPYHVVFAALRRLDCIVAGDLGCSTLGALPPYEAMDTLVAMGAAVGVGLGLRHALPEAEARRVVSVLGDATFVHGGITGVVEMVHNPPSTGHLVLVLDAGAGAAAPAGGGRLGGAPTGRVVIEDLARSCGVQNVDVVDPGADPAGFERLLAARLASGALSVVVARRPCVLGPPGVTGCEQPDGRRCERGERA